MFQLNARYFNVYFFAGLFSLLLSAIVAGRTDVINPDAICYLESAALMKQDFYAGVQLCGQAKWPFYSMCVAGFSTLFRMSEVASAYVIDALFSLITVMGFLKITALLSNKKRILMWAAVVILLHHDFNAVKTYIVRDHGFWAFYVSSIVCLLYYAKTRQIGYALAWNVCLLLATLFRIEGGVYLLLVPLCVWCQTNDSFSQRAKSFFSLYVVTGIVAVTFFTWKLMHPSHISVLSGRLPELVDQLSQGLLLAKQKMHVTVSQLETVLGVYGAYNATLLLFVSVTLCYFSNIVSSLSLIYVVLLVYAWYRQSLTASAKYRVVLWSYLIVGMAVTIVFFGENLFLTNRYLMAISLVAMCWIPFALESLMERRSKRLFVMALFLIGLTSIGGIVDCGYSKKYIDSAGAWVADHVPASSALYIKDIEVMYYSHRFGSGIFKAVEETPSALSVTKDQWKQYQYIVLHIDKKSRIENESVLQAIGLQPIQVFQNKRGDEVLIYDRRGA